MHGEIGTDQRVESLTRQLLAVQDLVLDIGMSAPHKIDLAAAMADHRRQLHAQQASAATNFEHRPRH